MEAWLKCEVTKGMFTSESAVQYKDASVFIENQHIDEQMVKVYVIEHSGNKYATLPTEYKLTILVDEKDVVLI